MTRMVNAYEDIYRSHVRDRTADRPHGVTVMRHTHDSSARTGTTQARCGTGTTSTVRIGHESPVAARVGRLHRVLVIGWYIHHHGRGHLARAEAVRAHLDEPVVALSSLPEPDGPRLRRLGPARS